MGFRGLVILFGVLGIGVSYNANAGAGFGPPEILNANPHYLHDDMMPIIITDRQGNWIAAYSSKDGDYDINFLVSTDNGDTWNQQRKLNSNSELEFEDDILSSMAVDPSGTWVAAWTMFDVYGDHEEIPTKIRVARSTNMLGWYDTITLAIMPESMDEIPFPDVEFGNGRFIAAWPSRVILPTRDRVDMDLHFSISDDGAQTWSAPAALIPNITEDDYDVDLETDNAGNWVATWLGNYGSQDTKIYTSRSSDNGTSWTAPVLLANSEYLVIHDRPTVTTDRSGNWMIIYKSRKYEPYPSVEVSFLPWVSTSTDNGATWSEPRLLSEYFNINEPYVGLQRLVTDRNGVWTCIWSNDNSSFFYNMPGSSDIYIMRSTNFGQSWSYPIAINPIGLDLEIGNVSVDTDGGGKWIALWGGLFLNDEPNDNIYKSVSTDILASPHGLMLR